MSRGRCIDIVELVGDGVLEVQALQRIVDKRIFVVEFYVLEVELYLVDAEQGLCDAQIEVVAIGAVVVLASGEARLVILPSEAVVERDGGSCPDDGLRNRECSRRGE